MSPKSNGKTQLQIYKFWQQCGTTRTHTAGETTQWYCCALHLAVSSQFEDIFTYPSYLIPACLVK